MKFEKYHALGNDYLVYDPPSGDHEFSSEEIIRICHRNFGLGSDGLAEVCLSLGHLQRLKSVCGKAICALLVIRMLQWNIG